MHPIPIHKQEALIGFKKLLMMKKEQHEVGRMMEWRTLEGGRGLTDSNLLNDDVGEADDLLFLMRKAGCGKSPYGDM